MTTQNAEGSSNLTIMQAKYSDVAARSVQFQLNGKELLANLKAKYLALPGGWQELLAI